MPDDLNEPLAVKQRVTIALLAERWSNMERRLNVLNKNIETLIDKINDLAPQIEARFTRLEEFNRLIRWVGGFAFAGVAASIPIVVAVIK